ncbi:NAD(P)H-dependent oxidoreductase [Paracidobacterium acidisoli]|uniref:Flavodoxin family protein n=1 Tax=Paracidobacterium acidisoli TaxID=2303751 RepID=A0A372INK3_9BACT|nr:NAD(P)H-dependent oxidoreductase [Paracidobacterium acidisoli]MBT9331667.1 NAD(P)H-dependent oxidoreductase [Paracidobacterium acidisoli]
MQILIVHAHPEPQSFCSSLARTAAEVLTQQGHSVAVSDLYAQRFDPVSWRSNFTTVKNAEYYKQQQEELYATEQNSFAPELEAEIRKLEAADLLIFSFPLWWFGLPAILKGWVDRAFPMGRVYGGAKLFEGGLGSLRGARAMALMTTGALPVAFSGRGVSPAFTAVMAPIQHGVFWFNGFQPLEPFVAWGAARASDDTRAEYLEKLRARLPGIFDEAPIVLPPFQDFPQWGPDTKKRFRVVLRRKNGPDPERETLLPAERAQMAEFRRTGFVLDEAFTASDAAEWRGFLTVRAGSADEVQEKLATLPLARSLEFEVFEVG